MDRPTPAATALPATSIVTGLERTAAVCERISAEIDAERASYRATWRERSRARLSLEPPHTEWNALRLSLNAIDEAIGVHRAFSWACSNRERIAALDYCVSRAFAAGKVL